MSNPLETGIRQLRQKWGTTVVLTISEARAIDTHISSLEAAYAKAREDRLTSISELLEGHQELLEGLEAILAEEAA